MQKITTKLATTYLRLWQMETNCQQPRETQETRGVSICAGQSRGQQVGLCLMLTRMPKTSNSYLLESTVGQFGPPDDTENEFLSL